MIEYALVVLAVVIGLGLVFWISTRLARTLEWGSLLIFFFLPFERIPTLDLAGFSLKVNHLVGVLIIVFWLLAVIAKRRKIYPNPLAIPLLLLLVSLSLSAIVAQDQFRAITFLVADVFVILLALVVPQVVIYREQLPTIIRVIFFTTWLTILFGIYQFLGDLVGLPTSLTGLTQAYTKSVFGFPRVQAFETEPLYLGNYLLMPISLIIAMLAIPQTWMKRWYLAVTLIAVSLIFGFTLSRGAFVGLFGVIAVLALFIGKRILTLKNLLLTTVGVAVAVVGISGILAFLGGDTTERFVSHLTVQDFGQAESTVGRLATWFQAIDLWKDSPWVGIGSGNFGQASLGYPPEPPPGGWPIVNNGYLEILAENGALGLGLFLFFLVMLFCRSWRAYWAAQTDTLVRPLLIGLSAAVFGILLQYNFFSTFYIIPVWVAIGFLMAIQTIALHPEKDSRAKS